MACQIEKDKGHQSLKIYDDSKMLIKVLNSANQLNNYALNQILLRIQTILRKFKGVESFHIIRDVNSLANNLENKACLLTQGTLCITGESSHFHPIP